MFTRVVGILLALTLGSFASGQPKSLHPSTQWRVEANVAYEALCFVNVLTGDPFYLRHYAEDYAAFKPRFTPELEAAIAELNTARKQLGFIPSAALTFAFSAQNPRTLDDLIATASNPEGLRRALLQKGQIREGQAEWTQLERFMPGLKVIFNFLKRSDFEGYWARRARPQIEPKVGELSAYLPKYNVLAAVEPRIGFALPEATIEVYVLYFNEPHGIRIGGASFIQGFRQSGQEFVLTAIHEMMHPPFVGSPGLWKALEPLRQDRYLMDKILNHNPNFGYNSFEAYVEENAVRALTQVIAEELGVAKPISSRWRQSEDDGIHILAAALYLLMKREQFLRGGETFQGFLLRMLAEGKLAAGRIEAMYRAFLGD